MKKVTLESAKNEAIGAIGAGAGVVVGSYAMRMASGKVNPWLVGLIGLIGGYGIRLMTNNETVKDVGTGLLIAGTLDIAKKTIDQFGASVPMLQTISANIPALSGVGEMQYQLPMAQLRGDYAPAQVVSSMPLR